MLRREVEGPAEGGVGVWASVMEGVDILGSYPRARPESAPSSTTGTVSGEGQQSCPLQISDSRWHSVLFRFPLLSASGPPVFNCSTAPDGSVAGNRWLGERGRSGPTTESGTAVLYEVGVYRGAEAIKFEFFPSGSIGGVDNRDLLPAFERDLDVDVTPRRDVRKRDAFIVLEQ